MVYGLRLSCFAGPSLTGDGFWDGFSTIDVRLVPAVQCIYVYITYRPTKKTLELEEGYSHIHGFPRIYDLSQLFHKNTFVVGTTATFGAPYYGERVWEPWRDGGVVFDLN